MTVSRGIVTSTTYPEKGRNSHVEIRKGKPDDRQPGRQDSRELRHRVRGRRRIFPPEQRKHPGPANKRPLEGGRKL